MKAKTEDDRLEGKIKNEDKQKILDKYNEIFNWFNKNPAAENEEFKHWQKELEKLCHLIITKWCQVQEACQEECPGLPR